MMQRQPTSSATRIAIRRVSQGNLTGEWIGYPDPEGVHLVAVGVGAPHLLHGPSPAFAFSRDGSTVYVFRHAADRHWELASLSVPGGKEKGPVRVNLSPEAAIRDMALHPDGGQLVASVGILKRDIWILDGFEPPACLSPWRVLQRRMKR